MADLTQAEKSHRYDKSVQRHKIEKVYAHVTALRLTNFAVTGVTSVGMGALKAAKPEWEDAMYSLPIDLSVGAIGFGLFVLAGEKRSGDYMREVGGGMASASLASLGEKGGRKIYEYATAP
jgi:hypothetical protein